MRKLRKIIVVFFVLFIIVTFITVQIIKNTHEERVNDYLLDEQGYDQGEIKEIKVKWGFKLPPFYTIVIFKDEPYVEYVYFSHNGVKQFEYVITEEGEKRGVIESELKHYVPFE